ncbi:MAG: RHS repeat-associated core domain-containing protein [Deltaproteobacteria bacterium]|nr:RHS repeat-associated core domain-containing protein [Deltaproteobacteria bacterium]
MALFPSFVFAKTVYVHLDYLGSLNLVTGESGEALQKFSYDPFGEVEEDSWPPNPFPLYATYPWDRESALYNASARSYDPITARFLSPDPYLGIFRSDFEPTRPKSLNPYSYVQNNPVNGIDPQGLSVESLGWGNFKVTPHFTYRMALTPEGIGVRVQLGGGFSSEGENEVLETLVELAGVFPHEMEILLRSDFEIIISLANLNDVGRFLGYEEREGVVGAGFTVCQAPYCIVSLGNLFFGRDLKTPEERVLLRGIVAHEVFGHAVDGVWEGAMSLREEVGEEQGRDNERRAIAVVKTTLPLLAQDPEEEGRFQQALEAYEDHLRTGDVTPMLLFLKGDMP